MRASVQRPKNTPHSRQVHSQRPDRATAPSAQANPFLARQHTLGNQALQRLLHARLLQAKLTVNQPGDRFEQEADRVADAVLRMPEPAPGAHARPALPAHPGTSMQRQPAAEDDDVARPSARCQQTTPTTCVDRGCNQSHKRCEPIEMGRMRGCRCVRTELPTAVLEEGTIQRMCSECGEELHRQPLEEEEELLQAKETPSRTPQVTAGVQAQINGLRGQGRPLPAPARAFMEPRFGYDFGQVRIHTNARAAHLARTVNAQAFTLHHNIVFGPGQFAPGTTTGKRLLAHELTHVTQQSQKTAPAQLQRQSCQQRTRDRCLPERHNRFVLPAFRRAGTWLPRALEHMDLYRQDPSARQSRRAASALQRHFNFTPAVRQQPSFPDIPNDVIDVINNSLQNISEPIRSFCPSAPAQSTRDTSIVFANSPPGWADTNCYEWLPPFFTNRTNPTQRAKIALHEMMHSWERMSDLSYESDGPPGYPPRVEQASNNADSYASLIRDLRRS